MKRVLLLCFAVLAGCEASPSGTNAGLSLGGPAFPEAAAPPRAAACPVSGPCLEPAQEPVLVLRGSEPARLVLRGWSLGTGGAVEVGGVTAEVESWSDDRVVVRVDGASVGVDPSVVLRAAGGATAQLASVVAPAAVSLPDGLVPGQPIVVEGDGFGATEGHVFFQVPGAHGDGQPGQVASWSETSIQVTPPDTVAGAQEVRVGRRIIHGGRDLGELIGAPLLVGAGPGGDGSGLGVKPSISQLACRVTKDEHCTASGSGWGDGYSITSNGLPVVPVQYSPGFATFDLPAGLEPGPVSVIVTTADGAASDPAPGLLYAWKRFRPGTDVTFEGVAGTVFEGDDRPWVLLHYGSTAGLLPHKGHAMGEVTCGWPYAGFGTDESAVFAAQLNVYLFLLAGPRFQLPGYVSEFRLASCKAKVGSGQGLDEELTHDFAMPEGGQGRVAGLAAFEATGEVLVLLRDAAAGRSHLLRRHPDTKEFSFTASIDEVGYLLQAGERAWFRTEGGDTIGVYEIADGAFVAIDSPGAPAATGLTFEAVATTGALRVTVDGAGDGPRLREWDPDEAAWKDLYGLPPEIVRLEGTLADPGGDLLLGVLAPDADGHTPLHVFQRQPDGSWTPVWEDLARTDDQIPGKSCRVSVGHGALLHSDAGLPIAWFEMGSTDCDEGLQDWFGPTTLWIAELLP